MVLCLTAITLRINRKSALIGLLGLFVAGQFVCPVAPGYAVLLAGRVIAALAQGARRAQPLRRLVRLLQQLRVHLGPRR